MKKIIIGTRGSQLALIQTNIVKEKLQQLVPHIPITVATITTKGDKNMNPVPLDSVGKGWFTKEIDKALLNGTIDVAVHSLKDLPEILPRGLVLAAVPKREDPREALVSRNKLPLKDLKKGAVVGTDSTRRKSQILHIRPDLVVDSVRGNVNTRLQKLDNGMYDALFLAVAGLKRLGLDSRITQYFPVDEFVPSPGQGALAVVMKEGNRELLELIKQLTDQSTLTAIQAERAFSNEVGGGCKLPVGMNTSCTKNDITMTGFIGSLDGMHIAKDSLSGNTTDAIKLAKKLAKHLLNESHPWYRQVPQE